MLAAAVVQVAHVFRAAALAAVAAVAADGLAVAVAEDTTARAVAVEQRELAEVVACSGLLAAGMAAMAAMVSVERAASPLPTIKQIHMLASEVALGAARQLPEEHLVLGALGVAAVAVAAATMPLLARLVFHIFRASAQVTA